MQNIEQLMEQGNLADAEGCPAAAFETFRLVIETEPKKDAAIYRVVKALLDIGRISDAERYLDRIRRNAVPKPWLIENILGQLRLAQFRPSEAEEHFRMALKLGSNVTTTPAVFLADCLSKQGRFEDASEVLRQALKCTDDLDEVYLNLGFVKRAQGDYLSAREFLLKALEIDPDYGEAKRLLADVDLCLKFKRQN